MRAVAQHGHTDRVDGGIGRHGVAFDAGNLHQTTDRIAGQSQIVLDTDFRGILHLVRRAAHHGAQPRRGHGTGCADLALTSDFGTGNGRVAFEQVSNRPCGQQERHHTILIRMIHEMPIIVEHRRNDASRTVGRRGDDASACRVLLGNRQCEQVDPCGVR